MSEKWDSLANLVTNRTSVMTPLLIFDALLLILGTSVYLSKGSFVLLIISLPALAYTLYRYEKFAQKTPWLLSSQKVAIHGMDLYGDNNRTLSPQEVIDIKPVAN